MIKALLIDDELLNLQNLEFLLTNDCEGVHVVGKAQNAPEAREWLKHHSADVVFLDIQMPIENGFQFLSSFSGYNFKVIFVTAFSEHALKAIKANAVDYLIKPVNIEELRQAVEKIKSSLNDSKEQYNKLIHQLLETVNQPAAPKKIALPQLGGISFIEIDNIVSLQADSNYTILHLNTMQKIVISKSLKEFEDLLDADKFVRIHKSYIVNLQYVKEYSSIDNGIVKMTDGNEWSVSRRQLDIFLQKMQSFSLMFGK